MAVTLTMIVRNEAEVIERCLASARPLIDGYVICDTGSTDDTIERIRSALEGIEGTIHERPWHDFGHNRNELLELAHGVGDHHLLLDADMTIEAPGGLPILEPAVMYLARHQGEVAYLAPRLIDARFPWRWTGSTHEDLDSTVPYRAEVLEDVRIRHHGDGAGRGRTRFLRDAELLERDLAADPESPRTHFYLGLVRLSLGEVRRGCEHLERRIADPAGPTYERFYAALRIAQVALAIGSDPVAAARRARDIDPSRAEGWTALATALRARGAGREALRAAKRARRCETPLDGSFVVPGASTWRADLELVESATAAGRLDEAIDHASHALSDPDAPTGARTVAHVRAEAAWMERQSSPRLRRARPRPSADDLLDHLAAWRIDLDVIPAWWATNPSITTTDGGFLMTVRLNNAGSQGGRYRATDRIAKFRTLNAVLELGPDLAVRSARPITDPARRLPPVRAHLHGTEDLRAIEVGGERLALGWAREFGEPNVSGPVLIDLADDQPRLLPQPDPARHEKNWMPFLRDGRLHLVTWLDPIRVYELGSDGGLDLVAAGESVAGWFTWRGGTQGVPVADGWLFVTHERIAHAGSVRYRHRFVLIDDDLRLAAAGAPFTMTGNRVEFATGLTRWGDSLLLSTGISDTDAALFQLDEAQVLGSLTEVRPSRVDRRRRRDLTRWPELLSHWDPAPPRLDPIVAGELRSSPRPPRSIPSSAVIFGAELVRVDDVADLIRPRRHRQQWVL